MSVIRFVLLSVSKGCLTPSGLRAFEALTAVGALMLCACALSPLRSSGTNKAEFDENSAIALADYELDGPVIVSSAVFFVPQWGTQFFETLVREDVPVWLLVAPQWEDSEIAAGINNASRQNGVELLAYQSDDLQCTKVPPPIWTRDYGPITLRDDKGRLKLVFPQSFWGYGPQKRPCDIAAAVAAQDAIATKVGNEVGLSEDVLAVFKPGQPEVVPFDGGHVVIAEAHPGAPAPGDPQGDAPRIAIISETLLLQHGLNRNESDRAAAIKALRTTFFSQGKGDILVFPRLPERFVNEKSIGHVDLFVHAAKAGQLFVGSDVELTLGDSEPLGVAQHFSRFVGAASATGLEVTPIDIFEGPLDKVAKQDHAESPFLEFAQSERGQALGLPAAEIPSVGLPHRGEPFWRSYLNVLRHGDKVFLPTFTPPTPEQLWPYGNRQRTHSSEIEKRLEGLNAAARAAYKTLGLTVIELPSDPIMMGHSGLRCPTAQLPQLAASCSN